VKDESFSSFEDGGDFNEPSVFSPPHTMDISSVRRPPVPAMVPANRVSTRTSRGGRARVVSQYIVFIVHPGEHERMKNLVQ